jgi:hypothetical protein
MDQRMARRERDQPAGDSPDWKAQGSAEGNGLRIAVVGMHYVESLVAQTVAQRTDTTEPQHFLFFADRAFRKWAAGRANNYLPVPPLLQASRQRQQQVLTAAKIPAGVDVSNLENTGSP